MEESLSLQPRSSREDAPRQRGPDAPTIVLAPTNSVVLPKEAHVQEETSTKAELVHRVWRSRRWPRQSHYCELVVGKASAGHDYMTLLREGRTTPRLWRMRDVQRIEQKQTKGEGEGRLHVRVPGYRRVRLDFASAKACTEVVDAMLEHRNHRAPTEINLLVGTWNVGNAMPQEDLTSWLAVDSDVYAIGVQEASYKMSKELHEKHKSCAEHFFAVATAACGANLHEVGHASMGSIHLLVLCKQQLKPFICDVESGSVPTGVGGVGTNKGGVAVSFRVCSSHVCVVNSHLAAHEGEAHMKQRNANAADISQHIAVAKGSLPSRRMDLTSRFTHLLWCGDLNYRIDAPRMEVLERVIARDWASLHDKDQLGAQIAAGEVFAGFREGPLNFAPTFKHVHGDGPSHNHHYESEENMSGRKHSRHSSRKPSKTAQAAHKYIEQIEHLLSGRDSDEAEGKPRHDSADGEGAHRDRKRSLVASAKHAAAKVAAKAAATLPQGHRSTAGSSDNSDAAPPAKKDGDGDVDVTAPDGVVDEPGPANPATPGALSCADDYVDGHFVGVARRSAQLERSLSLYPEDSDHEGEPLDTDGESAAHTPVTPSPEMPRAEEPPSAVEELAAAVATKAIELAVEGAAVEAEVEAEESWMPPTALSRLKPGPSNADVQLAPLRRYEQTKWRVPSWCDRVLWRSWPGCEHHLTQRSYESAPGVYSSDHSPVRASFSLHIAPPSLRQGEHRIHDLMLVLSELSALDLPSTDVNGLADPYIEVRASFSQLKRTSTYQACTLEPTWKGEVLQLPVPASRSWVASVEAAHLFVRVMDYDRYSRDDTMGCCVLSCAGLLTSSGEPVPSGRCFELPINHCGVRAGTLRGRLRAVAPDTRSTLAKSIGGAFAHAKSRLLRTTSDMRNEMRNSLESSLATSSSTRASTRFRSSNADRSSLSSVGPFNRRTLRSSLDRASGTEVGEDGPITEAERARRASLRASQRSKSQEIAVTPLS